MLKELLDSPKCQFKLIVHYSNPQRFPQTLFQGRNAPEFEPLAGNEGIESENEKTKTSNGETKTKNKKICKNKNTTKDNLEPAKKYSNHIEFIDYIPTHEIITYRHLFAYGFYMEQVLT